MPLSLDLDTLSSRYREGVITPGEVVDEVLRRIECRDDDAVWIHRTPAAELSAQAAALAARVDRDRLPLYGIPFAVKDNLDVEGVPTTAACPRFAYVAERHASAVARLVEAGALLIGKTNLDQFATGLVGVRSPYGTPRNAIHPDYVPGGSSSGSAVAVAAGLVSFALGTDTAGSGRVPAAFNNIVGLKPTRGLVSAAGVLPACGSLDCVAVFALTCEDARAVLDVLAGYDAGDPWSRRAPAAPAPLGSRFRFGVPAGDAVTFFGDDESQRLFAEAIVRLKSLGGEPVEFDYRPFLDTARLLYGGPWVAERHAAIREFFDRDPDALLPVTRAIIGGAREYTATDAFTALHHLEALRRACAQAWDGFDVLLLPTTGTIYARSEVDADPVVLNANLGHYTNFVNLLDLSAVALPAGMRISGPKAGTAFGVSLLAPAFHEAWLLELGARLHPGGAHTLGATGTPVPQPRESLRTLSGGSLPIAVFGAHLSGMPLNGQLTERRARLVGAARTAPCYRLYALDGTQLPKPALVRVTGGGAPIECEVWSVPLAEVGGFLKLVPAPLAIGTVELEDGSSVHGFVAEAYVAPSARDVTEFGGWRAYCRSRS